MKPRKSRRFTFSLILVLILASSAIAVRAEEPTNESFQSTWDRTDKPVADGDVSRTWMWGDGAFSVGMSEWYEGAILGGAGYADIRTVQYFDKSRMEITDPNADSTSPWYVTNGLLVMELITGRMQIGDDSFEKRLPAEINVAGDYDDPTGPTYASFSMHLDDGASGQESAIVRTIDRDGLVSDDTSFAAYGVGTSHFVEETGHWIATPFWEFMNSSGLVYEDGATTAAPLFLNPFYATGYPVTDAYWAEVKVADAYTDVLIQCFERRCLTYTPANDPAWRVEAGNVGQHYYSWRYGWGLAIGAGDYSLVEESQPELINPVAVVSAGDGTFFVGDAGSDSIFQFDGSNTASNEFGAGVIYDVTDLDLAPNGDLWVLDAQYKAVHRFSSTGIHESTLRVVESLNIQESTFLPIALAVDPSNGDLFILTESIYHPAHPTSSRVYRFASDGSFITSWIVSQARDKDPEPSGYGLDFLDGVLYSVSDTAGIALYSTDGTELAQTPGFSARGIAADTDGTLWLNRNVRSPDGETEYHLQQINPNDGHILRDWGMDGDITDISIDPGTGDIVAVGTDNPTILVYSRNPDASAPAMRDWPL